MLINGVSVSEIQREAANLRREIRHKYRPARVYFEDTQVTGWGETSPYHVQIQVPFRIADGNGGFMNDGNLSYYGCAVS